MVKIPNPTDSRFFPPSLSRSLHPSLCSLLLLCPIALLSYARPCSRKIRRPPARPSFLGAPTSHPSVPRPWRRQALLAAEEGRAQHRAPPVGGGGIGARRWWRCDALGVWAASGGRRGGWGGRGGQRIEVERKKIIVTLTRGTHRHSNIWRV